MMPNFAFSAQHFSSLLITLCLLTVSMLSLAESMSSSLKFEQLTSKDGLSQSYVYDMVQDKQGFIWIATQDGLNRYDGDKFVHYRYNVLETNSIANNLIRKVFIDSDNTLWVGTNYGLSKYNRQTDDFENYYKIPNKKGSLKDNIIWNIYQDRQNQLWITTAEGIHKYIPKTNEFEQIRIRKYEQQLKEIRTILHDKEDDFWFGTYENGIFITNKNQSSTFSLNGENKWNLSIPAKSIHDIKVIDNNYWLATDIGLFVVDENYQLVNKFNNLNEKNPLLTTEIRTILQIDDSTVWIGTINGVSVLSLYDDSIQSINKNKKTTALIDNIIFKLLKTSSDKVWIGTDNGVRRYSAISETFKHKLFNDQGGSQSIDAFVELNDESILFSRNNSGIYRIDINGNILKEDLNINDNVSHIISNTNNEIFIRTFSNRLYQYNPSSHELFEHQNWKVYSLDETSNRLLIRENRIWYINSKGKLVNYDVKKEKTFDVKEVENYKVTALNIDNKGDIWLVTTENDILTLNIESRAISILPKFNNRNYFINSTHIITVSNDWIWLGAHGQGLMLIDRGSYQSWVFNEENALKNNTINHILIDEDENAWFSTNINIGVVNPQSKIVHNFGSDFGVSNNEYLDGAGLKSSNGVFYFGGLNGFHYFETADVLTTSQQLNTPVFTDLLVSNKTVEISNNTNKNDSSIVFTLTAKISEIEQLILKHEQSPFSIEFVSPNAKLPNQLKYRYRLVGLEEKWIETDVYNRRATYTNLDAGDYTFEVQAIDLLGSSDSDVAVLKVTIMPPWWLSWWAYILYGIFLLSLVFAFIHSQRKKLIFERNVNAQLENKVVERTLQLQRRTEELQKSNIMLEEMSLTDQLTGLKNRRFLLNNIESDIALVLRKYKSSHESESKIRPEAADLIFFLIDLDHFKMVNDIHGHTAGDAVLIQIKVILEQVFRETDYLVRWGGEEFLVIARFTERSNASELAERLRQAVENFEFSIGECSVGENKVLKKTCSIGFACFPFSTQDTEALTWTQVIDVADHCMYAAKKSSRNAWVGLYSNTNSRGDDLFTAVIEQTQSLLQTDELEMLSSIEEVEKVNWSAEELIPVQASN